MALLKRLLTKFNGLHYSQEYLCLSKESLEYPLYAYLTDCGRVIKDITQWHLFIGYSPLIFAFSSSVINAEQKSIDISFSPGVFQPNEPLSKKDAIALLSLREIYRFQVESGRIIFYEGIKGSHFFISRFHQSIIQLQNKFYNKKPGNIFLEGNLYKQVQIAYSIPRKICLITVGENNLYNHFPTDLHGPIDDMYYVISLRHAGRACQQVESFKKIALSDIQTSEYKKAYGLGKNHTQPLKECSAFDFDSVRSKFYSLPLPKNLLSYRELELEDQFIYGIHKILLFRIVYEQKSGSRPETLSHIHNCYATWRHNQKLSSNLLLR